MTETNETKNPAAASPSGAMESQRQRWIKYGGNVALVSLLAIVLGALVIYAAQSKKLDLRKDMTSVGLYSLKPRTVEVIKNNAQRIKITSLYTRAAPASAEGEDQPDAQASALMADRAGIVSDLLDEYHTRGSHIDVDAIDPVYNPGKIEDLIESVTRQYGGEVKKYDDFARALKDKYAALSQLAAPELEHIAKLPLNTITDQDLADVINLAIVSVREIPQRLMQSDTEVQKLLKQKPPNYKEISDSAHNNMTALSSILAEVIENFKSLKDNKTVPEPIRAYMADSIARYDTVKQSADALAKEAGGLGELKLDTLRDALKQRNSILIRGDKDWRIIPYEKVWEDERDIHSPVGEGKVRPRFAGEQMISAAILALNHPVKPKLAFVRAGGSPLAESAMPDFPPYMRGHPGGPFNAVADRLREDYNYEVLEKDITGAYAMQNQGRSAPEPSDEDIKDAVWVVFAGGGAGGENGPSLVGPKLHEHLLNGGSALIVASPQGEDLSLALKDFGVNAQSNVMCVHQQVAEGGKGDDWIETAKRVQYIFEVRDWGVSPVTSSLRSLAGAIVGTCAVSTVTPPPKGVHAWPIIPIPGAPGNPPCWGEAAFNSRGPWTFKKDSDVPPPLYGGVVADKEGAGRIVVIGSPMFFRGVAHEPLSGTVDFPDQDLLNQGHFVRRFPGNGELFMNSVFFLSRQDGMIALSPAAMDVNRLELSKDVQAFWRIGILLLGLPLLVVIAGIMVFLSRRG